MIFDTHAHYDDEAFEEDREALLESLKDGGIGAVMNVAASLESCRTTLLLAGHYDWMYAALGAVSYTHLNLLIKKKLLKQMIQY